MEAGSDALSQLSHLLSCKDIQQFRLAEDDNLQQLSLVGFEVGEQAKLLEYLAVEVLRFVDDQYGLLIIAVAFDEELIDAVGIGLYAVVGIGVGDL